MKRELLVLRHGKSDWSVDTDDFYRPLKKRGVKAAKKIGNWLANSRTSVPDLIITSPAERALATARIVEEITGTEEFILDHRIYDASLEQLLTVLSEIPEVVQRLLIVGHNPGLEALLLHLATVPDHYFKDWKLLTTGTLAIVTISTPWDALEEQGGKFKNLVRGKEL